MADDYTRDWEVRSPIGLLGNLMDTLMVKPAPLFAAETLAVIDDVRPDAVAASFTLLGSLMAAEARAARPAAPRWKPSRCVAASCRPRSGRRGRST